MGLEGLVSKHRDRLPGWALAALGEGEESVVSCDDASERRRLVEVEELAEVCEPRMLSF
jgi:hypothetical protein